MSLIVHFLLGLFISFIGTVPPSMLNMTTLKITLQQSKKEGLNFAYGASIIIFIQAYIALYFTKYIHNNTYFEWYISVFSIVVFALLSVYFLKEAKAQKKKSKSIIKLKNNFLLGIILSSLNMFAVPFYCGVGSSLNMIGYLSLENTRIFSFVLGATLGTFSLLYLYSSFAIRISKKAAVLTKNLNYILSILTLCISVFTLIKFL